MSVSINFHSDNKKLEVATKIDETGLPYPVIKIQAQGKEIQSVEEITIFPSFEQVKLLHEELSKLVKHINAIENANKTVERLEAIEFE